MIETMTAFKDYEYNMDLTEELYKYVAKKVCNKTKFKIKGKEVDLGKKWKRIMMIDAVKEHDGTDFNTFKSIKEAQKVLSGTSYEGEMPSTVGECLVEYFEEVVGPKLIDPVFITGHPVEISPLAKSMDSDPRFVERFEIYIGGEEQGDNWTELNDPLELYERFRDQAARGKEGDKESHPMDIEFVEMMEYGMPPTTGLGPGIERIAMLMTETEYIDDVIFFPMMRPASVTDMQKRIYGKETVSPVKKK